MLEVISIAENQLHGTLPTNLCLSLPHLRWISIDTNHFSEFLPPSISNCSELELLDAYKNDFKGRIKIDFGKLQELRILVLGENNFESNPVDFKNLIDSLSNCSSLEGLGLARTQTIGALPSSIGNFSSNLKYIELFENYICRQSPCIYRQFVWPD
ncbi:putative non-specific serine/threonine protein kinase [Helianthus annuus]|nr:putative non-specific serine/threonine protein kinase [Helianthus annuus]